MVVEQVEHLVTERDIEAPLPGELPGVLGGARGVEAESLDDAASIYDQAEEPTLVAADIEDPLVYEVDVNRLKHRRLPDERVVALHRLVVQARSVNTSGSFTLTLRPGLVMSSLSEAPVCWCR